MRRALAIASWNRAVLLVITGLIGRKLWRSLFVDLGQETMPGWELRKEADQRGDVHPRVEISDVLDAYFGLARGALSHNTERAVRADLRVFAAWCRQEAQVVLPARTTAVTAFVDAMGRTKAPATVRRYIWSIAAVHKTLCGQSPLENAMVRLALKRMHRQRGRRQTQVQGLTWTLRNRLMEAAGHRLIDVRNCALLALAYDTLLRRSELVALEVSDLVREADGTATLLVRASKVDAEGEGALVYLARDTVQLVRNWLEHGRVSQGRLLRSVRKGGVVGEKLDPSQIPRIYKSMARAAGLPDEIVKSLAGHSTRIGPVHDMIASGIELPAILHSGRWKTTRMVQRYGERLMAQRSGAAQLARRQGR